MKLSRKRASAFSLVELIVVVAIIGALTAALIPAISNLNETTKKAKNIANAKNIERMSAALASLGVAHVIPDSMGGVDATARLFREGVVVPEGPMAGEVFRLSGLSDDDIADLGDFLRVQYDMRELRLVMKSLSSSYIPSSTMHLYCIAPDRSPARIEDPEIV